MSDTFYLASFYFNMFQRNHNGPTGYGIAAVDDVDMDELSFLEGCLETRLDELGGADRLRHLSPIRRQGPAVVSRGGRHLVDFSSNDYLGLNRHPLLIERAREWAAIWGAGSGASRLVTGSLEIHHMVEAKLAALKNREAALIMNSGFQANGTVLAALLDKRLLKNDPLVFCDRLIHASLHHGCRAAGLRQIPFDHNDMDHLETLLKKHAARSAARFIITESVFSMDGDRADLDALVHLAQRFGAVLYVDEAHATGVLGPEGRGLTAPYGDRIDVVMGTFGKALGGFGAYVAGSRRLIDYLVNRCAGLVYSTALPPAVLGAVDAALDLLPGMEADRQALAAKADRLRDGVRAAGFDALASSTQIVPAVIGSDKETLDIAQALEEDGLLAIPIRPPTVPDGTSRIRLSLSVAHTDEQIDKLLAALARLGERRQ